jgi:hypothetical protein
VNFIYEEMLKVDSFINVLSGLELSKMALKDLVPQVYLVTEVVSFRLQKLVYLV